MEVIYYGIYVVYIVLVISLDFILKVKIDVY